MSVPEAKAVKYLESKFVCFKIPKPYNRKYSNVYSRSSIYAVGTRYYNLYIRIYNWKTDFT